jgi:hypothetical protein
MRLTLSLILTLAPLAAPAAETVYYFVDEQGVPHFSNVPSDRRYRPLGATLPGAGALAPTVVKPRPAPALPASVQPNPVVEPNEDEAMEVEMDNDDHSGQRQAVPVPLRPDRK